MVNASVTAQTVSKTVTGPDLVQNYLDSLLRDVSVSSEGISTVPVVQANPSVIKVITTPVEAGAVVTREVDIAEHASQTFPTDTNIDVSAEHWQDNPLQSPALDPAAIRTQPAWASQGFSGLLFDVCGLKMAAPLHALGGISLIGEHLQPLVGQADWLMGLLRWNGRNLRVIDTARFVMPERLNGDTHRTSYQSVIILGDSHWALAVDSADESVSLKAGEIRWKQLAGSRPWLAGTLLHRLCALLDVDNLLLMLQQHEQLVRDHLKAQ